MLQIYLFKQLRVLGLHVAFEFPSELRASFAFPSDLRDRDARAPELLGLAIHDFDRLFHEV